MAKQRQIRVEQRSSLGAIQALEGRSDEELENDTKNRAAAQAILGGRAAERYDAKAAREHYRKAIAAARPQERMQLRRMAEASLALAERRADDLKVAVEKLGHEAPSDRQLFVLRLMGLIAPPPGSGALVRIRGFVVIFAIIFGLLGAGFLLAELVALPFGGISVWGAVGLGIVIVIVALLILRQVGKRRQARARAKMRAARSGG